MLCDDIAKMDAFYASIFSRVPGVLPFSYELESGTTMLRLRERYAALSRNFPWCLSHKAIVV